MCFEQFIRFEKLCARYLFTKKYEGLYECASFGQLGTLVMIQYEILLHFFFSALDSRTGSAVKKKKRCYELKQNLTKVEGLFAYTAKLLITSDQSAPAQH